MIVCKQCGHHNEDNATFCGSCGKFLEWTGERVAVAEPEPEPAPPPPPAPVEPAHHGLLDRVKQAVGIDETPAPNPNTTPAPPPTQAAAPVAMAPTAPSPAPPPAPLSSQPPPATAPAMRQVPVYSAAPPAPRPQPPTPPAAQEAEPVLAGVGAPVSPPASQTPGMEEPASRRPTSVAPAPPRRTPVQRPMETPTRHRPGDLICGQCGEGNDPARHFCRRCGNTLDEAIAVQLPWYRRFLNRFFGSRTYAAGERRKRVGPPNVMGAFFRIVRLAVVALIAIALLAFLLVPGFHNLVVDRVTTGVTAARMIVHPNYDPVHPTGWSATTSIAGHPPNLAADGYSNTYWASAPNDAHPVLTLKFATPTDLAEIGITSGPAGTAPADQYLAQPRPHAVHLVFSDGTSKDLTLADQQKTQFFPLDAKQVTSVQIQVLSTYVTAGPAPSSVAITEVEFRVRD